MKNFIKVISASLLSLSMIISLCSFTVRAESDNESHDRIAENSVQGPASRWYLSTNKVESKNIFSYPKSNVSHNGKSLTTDSRVINGITYVAIRSFVNEVSDMTVLYYSASRTIEVTGTGLTLSVKDGSNVMYANGRALFSMSPAVIMTNGRMYVPLRQISKALGLALSDSAENGYAVLTGKVKPLMSGADYYDADILYWLSRIISAESKGEPLLGQIAVGNVVQNRVKSSLYPNTYWGVIFDKKYGVQFSPVSDGSIYNAPTESAVTAAKICLEGHTITTRALFFLRPKYSTSSWIPKNRTYIFSIGNHDFYM